MDDLARVPRDCKECGFDLPAEARICPTCGHEVRVPRTRAELLRLWEIEKPVTEKQRHVFTVLVIWAGNETWECWPSVARIERHTGISRAGVFRALDGLERHGFIERRERVKDNRKQSNQYLLFPGRSYEI